MADFESIIKGFVSADGSIPSDAIANVCRAIATAVGNEFVDKARYRAKLDEIEALKTDKQTALDDLATAEKWKTKYDDLKSDYDGYKTAQGAKEAHAAKESAFRALLRDVGISEKRMNAVVRVSDIDALELDGDSVKNADAVKESVRAEWADFIVGTSAAGATTVVPSTTQAGRVPMSDIYKKDNSGRYILSTADRQKAIAENLSAENA